LIPVVAIKRLYVYSANSRRVASEAEAFMSRSVLCVVVCAVLSSSGPLFSQTPPGGVSGVPFISEVTPPSLPLTGNSGSGSATLTILGANFPQNAIVNLTFSGTTVVHPASTTVNASGSGYRH
jgi:hypothetical protein